MPEFDEDRDELLDRLTKECDISYVVNPGVDLETSSNAVKLAQKYPGAPPTDLDLLRRVRVRACLSGPERW